jgi:hypothetical protein
VIVDRATDILSVNSFAALFDSSDGDQCGSAVAFATMLYRWCAVTTVIERFTVVIVLLSVSAVVEWALLVVVVSAYGVGRAGRCLRSQLCSYPAIYFICSKLNVHFPKKRVLKSTQPYLRY